MADYATLYSKLSKEATDHDAETAKEKCPKKQKPAIYAMVANSVTDDGVKGVEVDVGKPTSATKKTDGDGLAKFDGAKVGSHGIAFKLSSDLAKKFVAPPSRSCATSQGKTSTVLVLLDPLPSFKVRVEQSDNGALFGGVVVELSGTDKLKQTTVQGTGEATFATLKPGKYTVKLTLTKTQLDHFSAPGLYRQVVAVGQTNELVVRVNTRTKANPKLTIEDPKVVVVKRAYMDKAKATARPHRLPVRLTVSARFDGTGALSCNQTTKVKAYKTPTDGAPVDFPVQLAAGELNQGVSGDPFTLYIEGEAPSGAMNDIELKLTLNGGTAILGPPVKDTITCVKLKLEICKWRVDDATDPVAIAEGDQIDKGRYVHVQDDDNSCERAKLIIHQAEPAAFTGALSLRVWDNGKGALGNRVELYDAEKASQASQQNPLSISNTAIPATGKILWAEGKKASAALLDTPIRLGLDSLPDTDAGLIEGDRVSVTVLKTTLEICQSRKKPDKDPDPMSAEDQIKKGRYLHQQDDGYHHGRAMILVKRVEPAAFDGKLTLTVWDVTARSKDNPRVEIFKTADEIAANGQTPKSNPYEFDHKTDVPEKGLKLWAEGKSGKLSAALRDTELRLGFKDHFAVGGRGLLTVLRFKKLKADIPSTPANTARVANSPVARHELKIADPAPTKDHFDESYTTNKPIVLVENSVPAANQIQLSVEVEPVGVPVRWATIRDRRPAPDGDHKDVIGLSGNRESPTLGSNAAGLTNTLIADAVGSFHICPFVDCNGTDEFEFMNKEGKRIDREPFIMMNLVLIRVKGIRDVSRARQSNVRLTPSPPTAGTGVGVSTGNFAAGASAGVHCKSTVAVISGGQDGQREMDKLFAGWVNNEVVEDARSMYQSPPGPIRTRRSVWSTVPAHTPFQTITAPGPAYAPQAGPVLDCTNFGSEGTGGNTCVGTEGAVGPPAINRDLGPATGSLGKKWEIEMWDSPGDGCPAAHESYGGLPLTGYVFNLDFRCDLCFWTNSSAVAGAADHPSCRLYSRVHSSNWQIRLTLAFDPVTGVCTQTVPLTISLTKNRAETLAAEPVEGSGLEVRSPISLNLLLVDARP